MLPRYGYACWNGRRLSGDHAVRGHHHAGVVGGLLRPSPARWERVTGPARALPYAILLSLVVGILSAALLIGLGPEIFAGLGEGQSARKSGRVFQYRLRRFHQPLASRELDRDHPRDRRHEIAGADRNLSRGVWSAVVCPSDIRFWAVFPSSESGEPRQRCYYDTAGCGVDDSAPAIAIVRFIEACRLCLAVGLALRIPGSRCRFRQILVANIALFAITAFVARFGTEASAGYRPRLASTSSRCAPRSAVRRGDDDDGRHQRRRGRYRARAIGNMDVVRDGGPRIRSDRDPVWPCRENGSPPSSQLPQAILARANSTSRGSGWCMHLSLRRWCCFRPIRAGAGRCLRF